MMGAYRRELFRRAAARGLMTAACYEVGLTCFESYPKRPICPVCCCGPTRAPRWTLGSLPGPSFAK